MANFITKRGSVTSTEVARLLGVSRQQAHAILSSLVRTGELIRIGHTRGARYMRSENALPARDRIDIELKNNGLTM